MKTFKITLILCFCFCFIDMALSQSYTIDFRDVDNVVKKVHVRLNMDWSAEGIFVEKEISSIDQGTVVQDNQLIFIGDFIFGDNKVELDYANNTYFVIPFNPNAPFFKLNSGLGPEVTNGSIFFDAPPTSAIGPGGWFFCSCNGTTPSSQGPGGCVSQLINRVVSCVNDGECVTPDYCIGEWLSTRASYRGGGLIIQTPKSKSKLVHNFKSKDQ